MLLHNRFYPHDQFWPTLVSTVEQLKAQEERESSPQFFYIFFSKLSKNWRYISKTYLLSFNLVLFYSCFFPGFLLDFVLLWTSRDQIFLPNIVFLQWHWWRHKSSFMKSRLKSNGRWQKYIPELDRVSLSEYVSTTYYVINIELVLEGDG